MHPFSSPEPLGLICKRPVALPSFPDHVTKKGRALRTRMGCTLLLEPDITRRGYGDILILLASVRETANYSLSYILWKNTKF